jgi:parallel beta-helix repeat protein
MRSKAVVLLTILAVFSFSQVQATIISVPGDQPNIQAGIDASSNGDTVLVSPNTYYEHINFSAKNVVLTSLFLTSGDTSYISTTIVDGNSSGTVITFNSGEDSTARVVGFTIQNGYVSKGGGISCLSNSSPTIEHNIFTMNTATIDGGGIYCISGSSPIIRENRFQSNNADWGGAIYCNLCSPVIQNNIILANTATNRGGGIGCLNASSPLIESNLFVSNSAGDGGGGIYCYLNSHPTIRNNTSDSNDGDGILCHSSSSPIIVNNIFSNSVSGYGISCAENSNPQITYSDIWNNTDGDYNGCTPGTGCISEDPQFCDPESGDYQLYSDSPCIGAGEGGSDIGAFGLGCAWVDVTASVDMTSPANTQVPVVFYVHNIGDTTWTFLLEATDTLGWNFFPTSDEMTLNPSQVDSITLTVSIPDATTGTINLIILTATILPDTIRGDTDSLTVTVSPRTIYVPSEQPTIQAGIDASGPGDTVLVAPNTYCEHPNFNGKAILLKSERGADSTIISKLAGGVSMVSFVSGEDTNSVLDGFTITGAYLESGQGAGIRCQNSSPKIINNRIFNNSCPLGAGIDCDNFSSPIITNNVIEQNPATLGGGGIRCNNNSSPMIRENIIVGNSAAESGAGVWCVDNCSPAIIGNLIADNLAQSGFGGGICLLNYSVADIRDNTIDKNSATNGGGIYIDNTSSATIVNTIITNTPSGKGIRYDGPSPITLYYSNVWNNLDENYYGCLPGEGCISEDPIFCNPANGDYQLWIDSPCLGTGDGGSDMGAFGMGCSLVGDCNGDGEVGPGDVVFLINYLFRSGLSPVPMPAGDCNSDGTVGPGDVVYLINYLFRDGPPPDCP